MAKRYLSNEAVLQFCACPYRYYLSTIKRTYPDPNDDRTWQLIATSAREAFYAHEREELSMNVTGQDRVAEAYDALTDVAVAHAISRASRHLDHIDYEAVESRVTHELSRERMVHERACKECIQRSGACGDELAHIVAHPPEMVARRIVDYRHRIVGTVSLIARLPHGPVPIQFIPWMLPTSHQEELLTMALKTNALLVSFELGEDVPLSAAYLTACDRSFYVAIDEGTKEQVKSFRSMMAECSQFSPNTSSCDTCHYISTCEYHDNGN